MLAIINSQNQAGNTPLHWAALNGHLEAVKVLLDNGGDPTITNARGHDAVYEAELNDKQEVVEWVLKEGGDGLEEVVSGTQEGDGEGEEEDSADKEPTSNADGEGSKLEQNLENLGITEDKTSG
jgi:ankyrin repeat protein